MSRPDASMELLNRLFADALDPDYQQAEQSTRCNDRLSKVAAGIAFLLVGALVAISALSAGQRQPGVAQDRAGLLTRVQNAELRHDQLSAEIVALNKEIDELRRAASAGDGIAETTLVSAALAAAQGPGIVLTINEDSRSTTRNDRGNAVLDSDLRLVVNGLWQAGAEAIAINGQRLSSRSAIRQAGLAITVNYRSLTPPYRIEAIGDPRRLPAEFSATAGGVWLAQLRDNYAVQWTLTAADQLLLPADPGLDVSSATRR